MVKYALPFVHNCLSSFYRHKTYVLHRLKARRTVHVNEPEGAYTTIVPELDVGEGNNKETQTQSSEFEERRDGIGRETQIQQPIEPAEREEDTNRNAQPQLLEPAATNSPTPTQPLLPTIVSNNLPAVNANNQHQEPELPLSLPGTLEHHGRQAVNAPPKTFPMPGNKRGEQATGGSHVRKERDDEVPDEVERINEQSEQATLTTQDSQVEEERDDEVHEDIDVGRLNEQPEQDTVSKHSHHDQIVDEVPEDMERYKEQPEQMEGTSDNQIPEDIERFNVQPNQATLDNQVTERYETPEQATVNKQGSQVRDERDDRVQNDIKRFSEELELPTLTPLDETPSTAPVQSPTITSTDQETAPSRSSIVQGETFESLERVRIRHESVQQSKKDIPKETAV